MLSGTNWALFVQFGPFLGETVTGRPAGSSSSVSVPPEGLTQRHPRIEKFTGTLIFVVLPVTFSPWNQRIRLRRVPEEPFFD